jgi:galactarate dehydratase
MAEKKSTSKRHEPRYIRLHPADNVAIIANDFGLPAGTQLPGEITLKTHVPQGHKIALVDLTKDQTIILCGQFRCPGRVDRRITHPHADTTRAR